MTKQAENALQNPHLMSAAELMALKDISPMTVTNWVRGGCPVLRVAPYIFDLDQVEGWLRARVQKHHVGRVLGRVESAK